MRIISRLLEATVALVFVFGLLGSLLTGAKAGRRALGRRQYSGVLNPETWAGGYAGSMGWDGRVLPRSHEGAHGKAVRRRRRARPLRGRQPPRRTNW